MTAKFWWEVMSVKLPPREKPRVVVLISSEQYINYMLKTFRFCNKNLTVRFSIMQTIEG